MSEFKVYCLKDPRDGAVRYIGITNGPLEVRLKDHYRKHVRENWPKYNWLQDLKELGLRAIIEEIETVEENNACFSEEFWIDHFKSNGANLFNLTSGGYGVPGLKFTDAAREKMSKAGKGKKKGASMRQKLADFNRTREFSPATRQKISAANLRYWSNPETREIATQRLRGRKFSDAAKQKLSDSRKQYWTPEKCDALKEKRAGEKNGKAKLNWDLVREIRAATELTVPELAKKYNVHIETIRHLIKGITWKE